METHFVYAMPKGRLTIAADEHGLTRIAFGDAPLPSPRQPNAIANETATQLQQYFAGKRRTFELPLSPAGTPFQLKVWAALRNIPYGQTRSYRDIAEQIGCPRGFRAVGLANNKNPLPIVVPCHRVVGADGSLTGYAGGLKLKRYLLELEGAVMPSCREGPD